MSEEDATPVERFGVWTYDELIEGMLSGLDDDYIGLWEIPKVLRDTDAGMTTVVERRALGLQLVRDPVLTHGLVPGFLAERGGFALGRSSPMRL